MPPAPYGVTPAGFSRPSVQEELAIIETDQRAEISQSIDQSTDSVLGQLNGIIAQRLGVAWEAIETSYQARDPDRAESDALTSLAKITGMDRRGASKSEVVARVGLDNGTTLLAGTHFAHVSGKPDVRFTPQENFTAVGAGLHNVPFESENTGQVQAPATQLSVIATPLVGWSSVTNVEDAVAGRDVDTDAQLRVRREQGLARAGSSTADAIRADVLTVKDVTSCQVFENWTDDTDADGLPPHSFEVVLFDDAGADDDAVAQAIWQSKAGGIQPYGQTGDFGTATDKTGKPQVMPFSRALEVLMYVEFDLTPREGYVGDAAFELKVVETLNTEFGTGDDVGFYDILDATHDLGAKITAVRFGTSVSPTTDTDVTITPRQIARFDTGRVAINP